MFTTVCLFFASFAIIIPYLGLSYSFWDIQKIILFSHILGLTAYNSVCIIINTIKSTCKGNDEDCFCHKQFQRAHGCCEWVLSAKAYHFRAGV